MEVVQATRAGVQRVDARTAEYYAGKMKLPHVYSEGHIPGSHMLAHVKSLDGRSRTFKSTAELRKLASEVGLDAAKPSLPTGTPATPGHRLGLSRANCWATRKRVCSTDP